MTKKKVDFDFDLGVDLGLDLNLEIEKDFDFHEKFTELCMKKIQKKKQHHDKNQDSNSKSKEIKEINFKKPVMDCIDLKPLESGGLFSCKKTDSSKKNVKPKSHKEPKCPKEQKDSKDHKYLKKLKHLKDLDKLDDLDDLKHLKKLKHLKSKKDCICKVIKKFIGKSVSIRTKSGETITGTIAKIKKDGCIVIDQHVMVSPPEPALRTIISCKDIKSISKFI
jgi:small nuclear ribonucleoprotein (snRNP)-like protein